MKKIFFDFYPDLEQDLLKHANSHWKNINGNIPPNCQEF